MELRVKKSWKLKLKLKLKIENESYILADNTKNLEKRGNIEIVKAAALWE